MTTLTTSLSLPGGAGRLYGLTLAARVSDSLSSSHPLAGDILSRRLSLPGPQQRMRTPERAPVEWARVLHIWHT
jgi:hypothetical protein